MPQGPRAFRQGLTMTQAIQSGETIMKKRVIRKLREFAGPHEFNLNRVTAASEITDSDPGSETGVAGIFKLKAHVDNPAQTSP